MSTNNLVVKKFGGSSLATPEHISNVASLLAKEHAQGIRMVVVVSAMAGETDRLLDVAHSMDAEYRGRELDAILATGEQVSAALLAMALKQQGVEALSMNGFQARITTDGSHNRARITSIDSTAVNRHLDDGCVVIVTGFQGVDDERNITTLGRGGSDTTAVALAAIMQAQECQIYTDVDGVYTTDPRLEPNARRLEKITFEEMLEMASLGSKVLQIRSVELAGKYNVPLRVLSTFDPEGPGTLISYEENGMEDVQVSGIAVNRDEAQLTLRGVPDHVGIAYQILGPVSDANIEVDMIVQNVGSRDGTADFTFTVHRSDYKRAQAILEQSIKGFESTRLRGDDTIVKVSLVGVGMRSHAGVAAKMFRALSDASVDIRMISTSEIKISVVIAEVDMQTAVQALHKAFDLEKT